MMPAPNQPAKNRIAALNLLRNIVAAGKGLTFLPSSARSRRGRMASLKPHVRSSLGVGQRGQRPLMSSRAQRDQGVWARVLPQNLPSIHEKGRPKMGRPQSHSGMTQSVDYSTIAETTPAPTVRPPSRMAKRRPFSIAIGAISSTPNFRLSPGITISVPSGSVTVPVTSVVRK